MTKADELMKKEAVMITKHIVGMPQYTVVGHGTYHGTTPDPLLIPKNTTDILVIYLKK